MALADSFLATCRVSINALAELTTFRSARSLGETEHTVSGRLAAWSRAYGDATSIPSPALNLARAIRETVNALADAAGTLGLLDRSSAATTLTGEYVPAAGRPNTESEETAAVEAFLREDRS